MIAGERLALQEQLLAAHQEVLDLYAKEEASSQERWVGLTIRAGACVMDRQAHPHQKEARACCRACLTLEMWVGLLASRAWF